ncbi:hypothetical protein NLJ89_g8033 [Agrocybe chaxingu]|uniref:Uncharacterized protein n=1 Tax=Agrocybe chaxingu TaxID=84603 RepID=A0A9W8MSI9_9AGAR|nr:hypothetical protein NLJ89_g8033 [Agrocybe chaxingu]
MFSSIASFLPSALHLNSNAQDLPRPTINPDTEDETSRRRGVKHSKDDSSSSSGSSRQKEMRKESRSSSSSRGARRRMGSRLARWESRQDGKQGASGRDEDEDG